MQKVAKKGRERAIEDFFTKPTRIQNSGTPPLLFHVLLLNLALENLSSGYMETKARTTDPP
jgi:hypothetical protein